MNTSDLTQPEADQMLMPAAAYIEVDGVGKIETDSDGALIFILCLVILGIYLWNKKQKR